MINSYQEGFLTYKEYANLLINIKKDLYSRERLYAELNGQNLEYEPSKYAVVSEDMGRISIRDAHIDNHIKDKFVSYARQSTGINDLKLVEVMFAEYNVRYGNPNLLPHYDIGKPNILLDYQLYSNISWPIIVDSIEYKTMDNSVLTIYNTSQIHYRPVRKFKDDEYVGVLFLNFVSDSFIEKKKDFESLKVLREEIQKCQNELSQKG